MGIWVSNSGVAVGRLSQLGIVSVRKRKEAEVTEDISSSSVCGGLVE